MHVNVNRHMQCWRIFYVFFNNCISICWVNVQSHMPAVACIYSFHVCDSMNTLKWLLTQKVLLTSCDHLFFGIFFFFCLAFDLLALSSLPACFCVSPVHSFFDFCKTHHGFVSCFIRKAPVIFKGEKARIPLQSPLGVWTGPAWLTLIGGQRRLLSVQMIFLRLI